MRARHGEPLARVGARGGETGGVVRVVGFVGVGDEVHGGRAGAGEGGEEEGGEAGFAGAGLAEDEDGEGVGGIGGVGVVGGEFGGEDGGCED